MVEIFDWKRSWCKPEGLIGLDDDGFLLDHENKDIFYRKTDVVSFSNIENIQCLILLGGPGSGKSIALLNEYINLKKKQENNIYFIYRNLNEFGDENRLINDVFKSVEISNWLKSDKDLILFLDSFDECLLEIRKLALIIKSQIEQLKSLSSRLYLRITCRTGFWTETSTTYFESLFGKDSVGIYELAPLKRSDVELALKSLDINSDIFIKAVITKEIQPLAINPLTLKLLINEYQLNKQFSSSKETLFYNCCKLLCTEPNYDRQLIYYTDRVSPEKRIALASRIAAVMIFCNNPIIDLSNELVMNESSITLDMLLEGEETTDDYSFYFTQHDLKETITQTSLFSSRGNLRFGFSHFAFAEFLAAKFIANHQLEIEQIKSLITISSDIEGKIIPQIKGTAAWLSILTSKLTEFTIKNDPQNLLYGDIENLNTEYKEKLVESLFKKFSDNTIDDLDWGLHKQYKKLLHPKLSEQVKPYIENAKTYFLARRAAIDIAEACNLTDLNDSLLRIALDESEEINARENATHALITLGDEDTKKKLIPLAIEPHTTDINDDLKGYALSALWPNILTTKEVFKVLTPPKRRNYSGGYVFFIYLLQNEIRDEDLDVGLNWILENCSNNDDIYIEFNNIEDIILYSSWSSFEELLDNSQFAKVLLNKMVNYKTIYPTPNRLSKTWKPLLIKNSSRIRMFSEIIKIIDINEFYLITHNELVTSKDFETIFNIFISENKIEIKSKLAKILGQLFDYEPNNIDLILSNFEKHLELKKEFLALIEPIELESLAAEKNKNDWKKTKQRLEQAEEWKRNNEVKKINVYERLIKDLDNFESNKNASSWYQLFMDLTLNDLSTHYGDEINSDITSLPGWQFADELIKQRIVNSSKYYIENFNEDFNTWFGTNIFYRPATAGYKSLLLLYLIDPIYIVNLAPQYWKNWMYILLDYPESYGMAGKDNTYLKLIQIAYRIIPNELINVLIKKITNADLKDETHLTFLHKVDSCMELKMQEVLLAKVQENELKPISQFNIYIKLLEKKNSNALKSIKESILQNSDELKIQLTKALACFCDNEDWEFIMNEILADNVFGQKFFLSFVDNYIVNTIPILNRLNEIQCAGLFLWLLDNFPQEEDPVFEGAHMVGSRESIGNFRDQILRYLTSKGTNKSIDALNFIQKEKSNLNIQFYLVEAKKNFRKSNWEPLVPKELLLLAINTKTRIILSSDDLLNLIIDSLKRLEVVLQGDNSLSSLFWDKIPSKKGKYNPKSEEILSDYIKHHLNYELKANGISSYREVQLRKPNYIDGGREGEKTDIYVSFTHPKTRESFVVIIELKGSWNDSVNSNMEKQLKDRYLKKGNCTHGLYLVGWYNCTSYDKQIDKINLPTLEAAKNYYSKEAKRLSNSEKTIKSFVLDCSLKN